jgi:hypothetical protein
VVASLINPRRERGRIRLVAFNKLRQIATDEHAVVFRS